MRERISSTLALVLGVLGLANGVYMTVNPHSWYWAVPGVPDRGPFNQHFVRDIGIAYALVGVAFICGALLPQRRLVLWVAPTTWLAGHSLFHFWEVAVGICGPQSLLTDFGGVTLPALIGSYLSYRGYRDEAHA